MIIRINTSGKSFRGAGQYHLHDKPFDNEAGERVNPRTADRVAWTATRNLLNVEPEAAIDEMWHTADNQQLLKREAGVARSGNRCTDPVKTISLSWKPTQAPTKEQMIDAVDSYLTHMGWAEHQALIVAHTDTAHPHVHIILNRVHPETGRTLNDRQDKRRSQPWGLAYERENGEILCKQRLEQDYAADGKAKDDKHVPNQAEKDGRAQEAPFLAGNDEIARVDATERDLLARRQQEEREAFFASAKPQFRAARQSAFHAVRAEFRSEWKTHFANERMLLGQARELARENATQAFVLAEAGQFGVAWQTLAGKFAASGPAPERQRKDSASFDPFEVAKDSIKDSHTDIAKRQKAETIERQQQACQGLYAARADDYVAIKQRQKLERAELRSMATASANGEAIDHKRLNQLLHGDRPMPTNAASLLASLRTANENAAPIDVNDPANDNRPPRFRADAAAVAASQAHLDLLLASARMTRSGSMVNMQMADMAQLARRERRELSRDDADRLARIEALDGRTAQEKERDRAMGKATQARDRGSGQDR